ncbi:MAG: MFS transporter [Pseudorhodobacter sp.]
MIHVLKSTWPLLLGLMLLMLGNGMQGSLLGIRGGLEQMDTFQLSVVTSGYFAGFLFGSRMVPAMIRKVGHVRVFAALGSMISAVLILYAVLPNWVAWSLLRVVIGFCFSGVYISAESWLNNAASNEQRGQVLSLYLIVQMIGIVAAQALLNLGDPRDYLLFVIPSVLVSLAFTPILLSAKPAPAFAATKPLSFGRLYAASPLAFVGIFLLGSVFSVQSGMAAVWGTEQGLSVRQITLFIASYYVGGLVAQYPIGWLSDRMDRRILIFGLSILGAAVLFLPVFATLPFLMLLGVGAVGGAVSNPLYSLLLAYVNDNLDAADMASASAGLLFINGIGAISGPVIAGWMMGIIGPSGFFLFTALLFVMLTGYTVWRMWSGRPAPEVTSAYRAVSPNATAIVTGATMAEADQAGPDDKD